MYGKWRILPAPAAAAAVFCAALIAGSAAARPNGSDETTRRFDRTGIYNVGGFTFSAPQQLVRPPIPPTPGVTFLEQDLEPEIKTDIFGNLYVTAIRGVPGGIDLWKSTDKGQTFTWLKQPDGAQDKCPQPTVPLCPAAGGGDDSIDVSSGGYLYISSLWLGGITMSTSMDGGTGGVLPGQAWAVNPKANGDPPVPVNDRQWMAAYGPQTLYMTFDQAPAPGPLWFVKSTDAGKTWSVPLNLTAITPGAATLDRPSNVAVDQYNGNIYTTYQPVGQPNVINFLKSTNGGGAWTQTTAYTGPAGSSVENAFTIMAVDRGGNIHMVFTECTGTALRTNCHVFLMSSTDYGATWLEKVRVDSGAGSTNTVMPWLAVGSDGIVNITWYGTTTDSPDKTSNILWHVFFAQTRDALSATPTFNQVQVSTDPVHDNAICSRGGACPAGTRDLIEYYAMTNDNDGNANIAYVDGIHNCTASNCRGHTWYTKQTSGATAYATATPTPVTFAPNLNIGAASHNEPNMWADSHNCLWAAGIDGSTSQIVKSTDAGASFGPAKSWTVTGGVPGGHGGDFDITTIPKADGTRNDEIYAAELDNLDFHVHFGKSTGGGSASAGDTYATPSAGSGEVEVSSDRMWLATDRIGSDKNVYIMDHEVASEIIRFASLQNDTAWSSFVNGSTDPELILPPSSTLPNTNPGPVFVSKPTHNILGVFAASSTTTNSQNPPFGKMPNVWESIGPPPLAATPGGPPGPFVNHPIFKGVIDSPTPDPTGFPPEAARTHGSHTGDLFVGGDADPAGNIYAVWITPSGRANTVQTGTTTPSTTFDVWFAASHDGGQNFYGPWLVSSGTGTSVMPWIAAGDTGKVEIVWYQSTNVGAPLVANSLNPGGPNQMPAGSTWNVMFAQSLNANSREPVFAVTQASDHVNHNGSIAIGGLTGGLLFDRSLADFIEIAIGPDGKANIAYADNGSGTLHLSYARQATGPLARTPLPNLGCLQPTAARLTSFSANRVGRSAVRVTWRTATELDTAGFNVWRSTSTKGRYVKVNTRLLPTKSFAPVHGQRYEFVDRHVRPGVSYTYKLEVVSTSGERHWSAVATTRAGSRAR